MGKINEITKSIPKTFNKRKCKKNSVIYVLKTLTILTFVHKIINIILFFL
jgi:hypothetical protein